MSFRTIIFGYGDQRLYHVHGKARVKKLTDIPQASVGAPIPVVIAGAQSFALALYADTYDLDWGGSTVRQVDPDTKERSVVIDRFDGCYVHVFGPPNSDAFSGHPLYERGLRRSSNSADQGPAGQGSGLPLHILGGREMGDLTLGIPRFCCRKTPPPSNAAELGR